MFPNEENQQTEANFMCIVEVHVEHAEVEKYLKLLTLFTYSF